MNRILTTAALLALCGGPVLAQAQNGPATTSGAYGGTNGTMGNTLSNRCGNLGGASTHAGEIAGTNINQYSADTTRTGQSNGPTPNARPGARQFPGPGKHGRWACAAPGGTWGSNF